MTDVGTLSSLVDPAFDCLLSHDLAFFDLSPHTMFILYPRKSNVYSNSQTLLDLPGQLRIEVAEYE
ncbi:hypothetical protein A0J61_07850 [Choanephora cucurbitarum]|uniref:Uncharacterized protein n=1 Tax=Choanephora cucurbitarum TaxID=101091 RepID=A0A1C7N502_9FUNG|nr:hypothetical protein A0J61_07850 [Choanephora cucurbitarum]